MKIFGRLTSGINEALVSRAKTPSVEPVKSSKTEKSYTASAPSSQNTASRFARWSQIGDAQMQISLAQSSERSLTLVYRELLNVDKQLGKRVTQPEQTANRLRQVEQHVSGHLSPSLEPKLVSEQAKQASYVMKSVDLLAPKAAETVNLVLPGSGRAITLNLPERASQSEVLGVLNQGLAQEEISARVDSDKQLVLSVAPEAKRKLDEPMLVTGQGVRIPAGNPVPIKLQPMQGELSRLADAISGGDTRGLKPKVKSLLSEVKHSVVQVRKFNQQLQVQLEQAKQRTANLTPESMAGIETELNQALRSGDFGSRMTSLLAQANVSRDTTVSILRK